MQKQIGNNLRMFQRESGLPAKEIQERLNISKTTYYEYIKNGIDSIQFIIEFGEKFKYDLITGRFFAEGDISTIHNESINTFRNTDAIFKSEKNFIIYDKNMECLSRYGKYLEKQGYQLRFLNLIDPNKSHTYNPMQRIKTENELQYFCEQLLSQTQHNAAHITMLEAVVMYLLNNRPKHQHTINSITKLMRASEKCENRKSKLDLIFNEVENKDPSSFTALKKASVSNNIIEELKNNLSFLTSEQIINLTSICEEETGDTIQIEDILERKIIYFILYDNKNQYEWIVNTFSAQCAKIVKNHNNIAVLNAPNQIQEIYKNTLSIQNDYNINIDIKKEKEKKLSEIKIAPIIENEKRETKCLEQNIAIADDIHCTRKKKKGTPDNGDIHNIDRIEKLFFNDNF